MLKEVSDFVKMYVESISENLSHRYPEYRLTIRQKLWLGFSLTGILLVNKVKWSANSRLSFGDYSVSCLSWMFRHSKINYELLLERSIDDILKAYGITSGHIIFDDTENERSKGAVHIYGLGKQKDKKSGGYFNGQNILYMVLVTPKVTIPIGFKFYQNDPKWIAWKKEKDRLVKQKVSKAHRPCEVERDYAKYPTKISLSIALAAQFKASFPQIEVKSVQGDCFYGTKDWTKGIKAVYPTSQIFDHCLLLHPDQRARISNNLPPCTVGSLREKAIQSYLLQAITRLLEAPNPKEQLILLAQNIDHIDQLRDSSKHLSGKQFEFT